MSIEEDLIRQIKPVIEEGNHGPSRKSEVHHCIIQCEDLKIHYAQHDKN
jgi:hypothetical protein